MTRYFFDCHCDGELHSDAFGIELALDEVADQAFEVVLELMKEAEIARQRRTITVKVRNDHNAEVYRLDGNLAGAYLVANQDASPSPLQ